MTIIYDVPTGGDSSAGLNSASSVRYGIQVNGATSALAGKSIKTFVVRLRKVTSPSGNITATVRNSADTVMGTATEVIDSTTLSTSFADVSFTFSSAIVLGNGYRILVEYAGATGIQIELYTTDQFDTSLTRRTRFQSAVYSESSTADISATITDGTFVSNTDTHTYNIETAHAATASKALTFPYDVRHAICEMLMQRYGINLVVTNTDTHKYKIPVQHKVTHKYDILQVVSTTTRNYVFLYNIRQAIANVDTHTYNIRKLITQTDTLTYKIAQKTGLAASIIKYAILQKVSQTDTHTYGVRQVATAINILKYNLRQIATSADTLKYAILQKASNTDTIIYNLESLVLVAFNTLIAKYNQTQLTTNPQTHNYAITTRTGEKTNTFKYSLSQLATSIGIHKYGILTPIQQALTSIYEITGLISATNIIKYAVDQIARNIYRWKYDILGFNIVTSTLTAKYRIGLGSTGSAVPLTSYLYDSWEETQPSKEEIG